jgi:hypothetical protein
MARQSSGRMSTDEVLQEMYEIWLSECGGTSASSLSPVQLTFIFQQKGTEVEATIRPGSVRVLVSKA